MGFRPFEIISISHMSQITLWPFHPATWQPKSLNQCNAANFSYIFQKNTYQSDFEPKWHWRLREFKKNKKPTKFIFHILESLWPKFEKMNNWSLQLMSIIKKVVNLLSKFYFWCNLSEISVFDNFRDFFFSFCQFLCPKKCQTVLDLKYVK